MYIDLDKFKFEHIKEKIKPYAFYIRRISVIQSLILIPNFKY